MPHLYPRLALLAAALLPFAATGQHRLTAIGVGVSSGFSMAHWRTPQVSLPGYTLRNDKIDDFVGGPVYQGSLYARFDDLDTWWFLQPEAQFSYGAGSGVSISPNNSAGSSEYYEHIIRRADAGLLGGIRLGADGSSGLLIGPALAYNIARGPEPAEQPENQAVLDAVAASTSKVQVLGRAALFTAFGPFDLRFAYELGLTPAVGRIRYQGQPYQLPANYHVATFTFGLRLYNRN